MRETPFKNKVERLLKNKGAWYIKYWAGNNFTKEGVPDVLACIDGKFYGIELKGDGGRPTLLQLVKLRNIRKAGGVGVLLYPEDLISFENFINGSGKRWYHENMEIQQQLFDKLNK